MPWTQRTNSLLCHQAVLATSDQGRDGGALGDLMKGFLEKEEVCTLSQKVKIRSNKNPRNSKQVHENSNITGHSETQ